MLSCGVHFVPLMTNCSKCLSQQTSLTVCTNCNHTHNQFASSLQSKPVTALKNRPYWHHTWKTLTHPVTYSWTKLSNSTVNMAVIKKLPLSGSRWDDVTRLWFSELRPHGSSCRRRHHRLSVCVPSAVLPLVFPPGVRGGGGRLVRGDHRGRRLRLVMDGNTRQTHEMHKRIYIYIKKRGFQ